MPQLPDLPPSAFEKLDGSPDARFYEQPRFVSHIDEGAVAAVTRLYRDWLPPGGDVLDLMSSWVSHYPDDIAFASVVGHGMNPAELAANPRLTRWFVQDLNAEPALPVADRSFDAATLCVSVQYLQQPVRVFTALRRALRPGAPVVVSFSNRCFPTKAVAIWQVLDGPDQQRLVLAYLQQAGFTGLATAAATPRRGDPLWAAIGRAPDER